MDTVWKPLALVAPGFGCQGGGLWAHVPRILIAPCSLAELSPCSGGRSALAAGELAQAARTSRAAFRPEWQTDAQWRPPSRQGLPKRRAHPSSLEEGQEPRRRHRGFRPSGAALRHRRPAVPSITTSGTVPMGASRRRRRLLDRSRVSEGGTRTPRVERAAQVPVSLRPDQLEPGARPRPDRVTASR